MIHNGTGVDNESKLGITSKIKQYDETTIVRIKTSRVDFLRQLYEDLPPTSEKVQLMVFLNVRNDLISEALANLPTFAYPVYVVKVGNTIKSEKMNEAVSTIKDWDAKGFLEFINQHVVHS